MTLEEMWTRLVAHQPFADERGYGPEWAVMCAERTFDTALAAAKRVRTLAGRAGHAADAAAWAGIAPKATGPTPEWAEKAAVRWIEKAEAEKWTS